MKLDMTNNDEFLLFHSNTWYYCEIGDHRKIKEIIDKDYETAISDREPE